MKNSDFRNMYSPTFDKDGIKMKLIGNWQDLVAYYEGSDGNAWAYHKSGGKWSNSGDIDNFRSTFSNRFRGELYDQGSVAENLREYVKRIVTENIELPVVKVKYMGEDDWSQPIYSKMNGKGIYVKVDGQLYTTTNEGEPYSKVNFTPEYVDSPEQIDEDVESDDIFDNPYVGVEQIKRFSEDLKRSAKEEIKVEKIGTNTIYAFGSELACYRMHYPYVRAGANNKVKVGFSDNMNSWYFRIEI